MKKQEEEWISTGRAAKILGYSRLHFLRKFKDTIPYMRLEGSHYRWLASAVHELAKTK